MRGSIAYFIHQSALMQENLLLMWCCCSSTSMRDLDSKRDIMIVVLHTTRLSDSIWCLRITATTRSLGVLSNLLQLVQDYVLYCTILCCTTCRHSTGLCGD